MLLCLQFYYYSNYLTSNYKSGCCKEYTALIIDNPTNYLTVATTNQVAANNK